MFYELLWRPMNYYRDDELNYGYVIKFIPLILSNYTSDPSGKVVRNVPLFGLFEVRKKRYTLYMVYYRPFLWYTIYHLHDIYFGSYSILTFLLLLKKRY